MNIYCTWRRGRTLQTKEITKTPDRFDYRRMRNFWMSQKTRWLPSPKAEDPHAPRPNKLAPRDLARTLHTRAPGGTQRDRYCRLEQPKCPAPAGGRTDLCGWWWSLYSNEERRLTLHRTPASISGIPVWEDRASCRRIQTGLVLWWCEVWITIKLKNVYGNTIRTIMGMITVYFLIFYNNVSTQ